MKMFAYTLLFAVCSMGIVAQVNSQECLTATQDACRPNINKQSTTNTESSCNSRYGAIGHLEDDLNKFALTHIIKNFEYLLMSTHFANYDMNREGFHKLFRGYADSKWEKSIELMKHISKRGGKVNMKASIPATTANYELYEIESLAKALDMEKSIMNDAYYIHERAIRKLEHSHDPEISHYIEEEFVEKSADTIRELSGHVSDLSKMLGESQDNALSLYLFDDYLKNL
ncbi:soma ferritin [Harmonia axyridis]|uniref:soma ferritin n=1 Tax=Harmonia axyridis TaxID=115357 RepID=UPI001E27959C|nr:soma ferritin [Harmonia axyridis]